LGEDIGGDTVRVTEPESVSVPPRVALPEPTEPALLHSRAPIDMRNVSLTVLAVLGVVFTLHWASAVFIPVVLGLMLSYALAPLVDRLQQLHLPRALAAALLLASIVGGLGWTVYTLSDDAAALVESLPEATQKVRDAVHARRNEPESAMEKVQRAAAQLEQVAMEGGSPPAPARRGVTTVRIERPHFDIKDYLWSGTIGVAASVGQAVVVVFITFFLLASGRSFRRKVVRIAGPTFARRRITVEVLDEITQQVQRYLMVQVFTSLVVGVVIWLAFLAIGVEHAAVWGAIAFVLDFVPYLGAMTLASGSTLVAFLQFGSLDMAFLVGGVAMGVHTLSGNLLSPWLNSRAGRLNAVVVFIGVLAFGWLWGIWGLLLGVPVLATIKAVCDRVGNLKPVGDLLGS